MEIVIAFLAGFVGGIVGTLAVVTVILKKIKDSPEYQAAQTLKNSGLFGGPMSGPIDISKQYSGIDLYLEEDEDE